MDQEDNQQFLPKTVKMQKKQIEYGLEKRRPNLNNIEFQIHDKEEEQEQASEVQKKLEFIKQDQPKIENKINWDSGLLIEYQDECSQLNIQDGIQKKKTNYDSMNGIDNFMKNQRQNVKQINNMIDKQYQSHKQLSFVAKKENSYNTQTLQTIEQTNEAAQWKAFLKRHLKNAKKDNEEKGSLSNINLNSDSLIHLKQQSPIRRFLSRKDMLEEEKEKENSPKDSTQVKARLQQIQEMCSQIELNIKNAMKQSLVVQEQPRKPEMPQRENRNRFANTCLELQSKINKQSNQLEEILREKPALASTVEKGKVQASLSKESSHFICHSKKIFEKGYVEELIDEKVDKKSYQSDHSKQDSNQKQKVAKDQQTQEKIDLKQIQCVKNQQRVQKKNEFRNRQQVTQDSTQNKVGFQDESKEISQKDTLFLLQMKKELFGNKGEKRVISIKKGESEQQNENFVSWNQVKKTKSNYCSQYDLMSKISSNSSKENTLNQMKFNQLTKND